MEPRFIRSRDQIDLENLNSIARSCNVSSDMIEDIYSCTPLQEILVTERNDAIYQFIISLQPEIDIDRFLKAIMEAVSQNSVYRTRIVETKHGWVQVVIQELHSTERCSGKAEDYLQKPETARINPGEPLFQTKCIGRDLFVKMHHAILDLYSWALFLDIDILKCYQQERPKKRLPYKDFVIRSLEIDETVGRKFWSSRFKGNAALFPAPKLNHFPRGGMSPSTFMSWDELGQKLLAAQIPSYFEAAWSLVSSVYTDSQVIVFGTYMSSRPPNIGPEETWMGLTRVEVPIQVFVNPLMTVEAFLKERMASSRQLISSPALQYGLQRTAKISESASIATKFTTVIHVRPAIGGGRIDQDANDDAGAQMTKMIWHRGLFPLTIMCNPQEDGIFFSPRYDPEFFSAIEFDRVMHQLRHTMCTLLNTADNTKLDTLRLLNEKDRQQIFDWNLAISHSSENQSVLTAFKKQAHDHADEPAVITRDSVVNYKDLSNISDQIALRLMENGIKPGHAVAVLIEDSIEAVLCILGILKAAAVYVPLNPTVSSEINANILSKVDAKIILTSQTRSESASKLGFAILTVGRDSWESDPVDELPGNDTSDQAAALILFDESSSTGVNGTIISHRALYTSVQSVSNRLGLQPGAKVLQYAFLGSIVSLNEIFGALLNGGSVLIPTEKDITPAIIDFIGNHQIDIAFLPSHNLRRMSPSSVPSLELIVSYNEALDSTSSKKWASNLRLINGWQSRETSGLQILSEITDDDTTRTLGYPTNSTVWITEPNDTDRLRPIGGVGELLIEGPGNGRSLDSEGDKSSAFIGAPQWAMHTQFDKSVFFRTGDLVKYKPDGKVEFVGRKTNRVKISNQIIQFEEIETEIASHEAVQEAVTLSKIHKGKTQLFIVMSLVDERLPHQRTLKLLGEGEKDISDSHMISVKEYASSRLPTHKIPAVWVAVEKLPRSLSGSLDRTAVNEWLKAMKIV